MVVTRNEVSGSGTGEHTKSAIGIEGTGRFTAREGSKLTINNHHSSMASSIYLAAAGSQFIVEKNAEVNVNVDSYTGTGTSTGYSNIPIYMGGGTMTIGGALNVNVTNNTSNGSNIVHANAAATFTVESEGTLDIKSDSAHNQQNLIYMGGSTTTTTFQFSDAKRVNLQRTVPLTTGTNNNNSGLINSRGVLDVSVQNVYQWNYNNVSGGADGDSDYDYDYVPMSNMKINYANNAVSSIGTANAMTNDTLTKFKTNFTTRTQRILFTRIPDPSVAIHSIANDNPDDPGSKTVYGYAIPNTYIRIWEEALNGTTSAKPKGTGDTVASPVEDASTPQEYRDNFTVQADANGDWSYTLPSGSFTAGNIIHAYGFANLKYEEPTQVVLDKTKPTADGLTYYMTKGDPLPTPQTFVENEADTSPLTTAFDYAFTDPAEAETQRNTAGTHTIKINLSDRATDAEGNAAPNTAIIEATLVVYDTGYGIEGTDFEANVGDVPSTGLEAYILANSSPEAFKLASGAKVDLSDKVKVSDYGGLDGSSLKAQEYTVTLIVRTADSGLATDITTTITVTLKDDTPPTGTGKLTIVPLGDAGFIRDETDLSKFLKEYSDDTSAKDDISIRFADNTNFDALVATEGDNEFYLILTDEAGNDSDPVRVPIYVFDGMGGQVSIKGSDFRVDRSEWDANAGTAGALRNYVITKGNVKAIEVIDDAISDVTSDTTKVTVDTSQVGTDEVLVSYPIVLKITSNGETATKTINVTFNDTTAPTATGKLTFINKDKPEEITGVTNLVEKFLVENSLSDNVSDPDKITVALKAGQDFADIVSEKGSSSFVLTLTDEAGNTKDVTVPIYVKDENSIISDKYVIEASDFSVAAADYPKTQEGITEMIQTDGKLALWEYDETTMTKLDEKDIVITKGLLPDPPATGQVPADGEYEVTLSYGEGTSKAEGKMTVTITPSDAILKVRFVDDEDNDLVTALEIDVLTGDLYDLTGDEDVADKIAAVEAMYYDLTSRPSREDEYEITANPTIAKYQFSGKLAITSRPLLLDFQKKNVQGTVIRENEPVVSDPLKIADTRSGTAKNWTLKVTLSEPLTSEDGKIVIPEAIRYKRTASSEEFKLNDAAQVMASTDNSTEKSYDISSTWGATAESPGFKLEVPTVKVAQLGKYSAELTYTLSDAYEP